MENLQSMQEDHASALGLAKGSAVFDAHAEGFRFAAFVVACIITKKIQTGGAKLALEEMIEIYGELLLWQENGGEVAKDVHH